MCTRILVVFYVFNDHRRTALNQCISKLICSPTQSLFCPIFPYRDVLTPSYQTNKSILHSLALGQARTLSPSLSCR